MVAKIWWKWIRLPVRKDQCADGVKESACYKEVDGLHAELGMDGTDQKNNDPAHQQKTDVRHQDGNPAKENGLKCNEESCQTPDDPE